ncbi:laminin subunit alpha-1 isoform X2 [Ceratitis capitata]|uniref:laminin subunit alpha-1 isoform X2 n=1 Tax=Ceratitis capitata TaxID=7213 RepID=UPI000C6C513C|nr:laminin subunit alpha-1 isoform X2 [Ceratitis capitata]
MTALVRRTVSVTFVADGGAQQLGDTRTRAASGERAQKQRDKRKATKCCKHTCQMARALRPLLLCALILQTAQQLQCVNNMLTDDSTSSVNQLLALAVAESSNPVPVQTVNNSVSVTKNSVSPRSISVSVDNEIVQNDVAATMLPATTKPVTTPPPHPAKRKLRRKYPTKIPNQTATGPPLGQRYKGKRRKVLATRLQPNATRATHATRNMLASVGVGIGDAPQLRQLQMQRITAENIPKNMRKQQALQERQRQRQWQQQQQQQQKQQLLHEQRQEQQVDELKERQQRVQERHMQKQQAQKQQEQKLQQQQQQPRLQASQQQQQFSYNPRAGQFYRQQQQQQQTRVQLPTQNRQQHHNFPPPPSRAGDAPATSTLRVSTSIDRHHHEHIQTNTTTTIRQHIEHEQETSSTRQQQQIQQQQQQQTNFVSNSSSTVSRHQQQQQQSQQQLQLQQKQQHTIYDTTTIQNRQDHVVIQGNADIVVYRNIGTLPCPPGVRLVPHRFIPVREPQRPRPRECQCSPIGAVAATCDKRTGQCACHANVTGRRCDKCKSGHWNLTQGVGCHDCRCDPAGSRSHECNPWTGQCDCKIGVGGQHCNECTDGFYGFSTDGCQRCTQCAGEGQVCDPLNGRCICPPNSRGLGCAQCVAGTWGWQPRLGCRQCACDRIGSIGQLCESLNGQCQCREGYAGRQCDTCAIGYFGYPECRRCNCNVDGSFVHHADGAITCDANGQCPCKALVVGLKCDTCMKSTFGLSALNPEGCTRCFCFGRSSECVQSEWSWGHIRMAEARNLSVQYLRPQYVTNTEYEYIVVVQMAGAKSYREDAEIHLLNDLNLIPRSTGNVSIGAYTNFFHPLYFQLPPQFYGDRTSSYGGYLYFTLLIKGANRPLERKVLSRYPLVQIHSHKKLVLDYFEYENYEYALNVTYKVPLHESEWKYHHNSQTVDRANLMAALQNVQHIFVRASAFADFTEVVLNNVHMDSAIYVYGSTNMIAKGVEQCKCPKRYDGLSCQDPGKGYYRYRNVTEIETVFIEDLIGRVVPCHCNGRSNECESETGVCLNCRDNTGGDHCEQCADGFYGDPNSPYGCQSCPCPETSRNFAKGCNVWQGEVSCICKPGYTGKLCDQCRPGYFGNPLAYPNSTCQPCNCNMDGSANDDCDSQTGQCQCRSGVTGLKCDRCIAERHHLEDRGCRICDNCTLLLLDYVELISNKLRRGLHNMDLTGIPAPYLKVEDYEHAYNTLQIHYEDYTNARKMLGSYDANELLKIDSHAENNKYQSRKALSTATKRQQATVELRNDVSNLYVDIGALRADILQYIFTLNNYGKSEQHMSLPMALDQARFYLDSIRQHEETVENIRNSTQCAWHFYYHFGNASDAAFDQKARVEMFWRDLNQTNFRISDMRLHADRTVEMQNEIDDTLEHVMNLRNHVVDDYNKINELGADVMDYLNQSLIPRTDVLSEQNWAQQERLTGVTDSIDRLVEQLNISLGDSDGMQREVRKHWLPKAQKHADRLMERSNEYARQFQPTRNGARIALLASSAHKNISDAIDAARQASLEATERVSEAQQRLYPDDDSSVIERAKISLNKSKALQKEALTEMERTNALKQKLKIHEDKVQRIKSTIYDAGTRTNNVSAHLHAASNNSARKLALESIEMAKNIGDEMRHELQKARRMHEEILKLREKFAILEPDWEIKLGRAEENISLTKTNIRLANISLSYVEEQSQKEKAKFDEWNNTMSTQVQELRDKIAKARHAAEGIKISLESLNPKCARTYLPTLYGLSTSNTIKMSFALPNRNGNSPLLHIQGSDGRYIVLELYKRHVRLAWNLGGTTAIITHPLEVQTRDPKYDDAWYHVEANRTLNIGSLLVRRMNNYGALIPGQPVSGNTDAGYTRFFQTLNERIHLGNYPSDMSQKEMQQISGLNVVVHNVEVDNRPLGIWNFLTSEGRCGGAIIGAQESTSTSIARHFNGLGYAEVKKSRLRSYRANLFALQMTFKTLDENALLFLAVDDAKNRSVSVTLSRGRIMFRIDYGDEAKLEINTTHKYNTGKWVKIEAARQFVPKRGTENGILRVDNEPAITGSPTVPIKSHMLPDLSKPVYYLGGVPPGFKSGTSKAPGADNPFLGCMKDVQVNHETYDPLESSTHFGVEPSCKDIITKAGFTGQGYIELPSHSLRKRANTGFVFRTLQPDCLLLLSAYPPEVAEDYDEKDIKGNYSVSLIDGHLQVWVNSGRGLLKMSSNNTLNDGEFHVVNLIKTSRKFELMLDDELQDTKSLTGTPTLVSMPRDAGGLYIGGAPPYEEYTPLAPTFIKLEGAIRDVVFNNHTINLNQAVAFSNVQVGRNGPPMGTVNGVFDVLLKTEPMIAKSFTASPERCLRDFSC